MPGQSIRYCSIMGWLADQRSEFADAITSTCDHRLLNLDPRQKKQSVTFLYPSKKVRDSFIKLAEKNPEDASKQLRSMFVHKYIGSLDDFDGCYNMLEVVFRPTGKTKDSIFLGKAEIVKSKFPVRTDYADKIAVWEIKNDEIPPISGEARTVLRKKTSKKKSSKKGRGADDELPCPNADNRCTELGKMLRMNVVGVALSLIEYIQSRGEYDVLLKNKLITNNPVATLFLIMEPNNLEGNTLVSKEILNDFLAQECYQGKAGEGYLAHMKTCQIDESKLDENVQDWVKRVCALINDKLSEDSGSKTDGKSRISASNSVMCCLRSKQAPKSASAAPGDKEITDDIINGMGLDEAAFGKVGEGPDEDEGGSLIHVTESEISANRANKFSSKQRAFAEYVKMVDGGCPCDE